MTYLGRLDPMAEGLLLVLAGDTKEKNKYLELDKTYEFEVLWGFETDTYDILGLITKVGEMPTKNFDKKMPSLLKKIGEKKTQEYPPYSSRTVLGRALHSWAREGKINEIEIPTRQIKIFSIEHIETRLISQKDLFEEINRRVELVKGDFRQKETIEKWKASIKGGEQALVSKFKADVSSGTYIRSLAHEMGEKLDCGALAYSIKRTRVGGYKQ
jgi:tRNA pseudouridine55 synthase